MTRLLERGRRRLAPAPVAAQWTHGQPAASEALWRPVLVVPFAPKGVHPRVMRAQILDRAREPLTLRGIQGPRCGDGQVRVSVSACAVCRTDLHVLDGELTRPKLPLVLGHQIVGNV